ncbi:MAG: ABC transporter substrate-binding protein [Bdellovibrionaceae bacterium]|nr:ABC transporter substrate-binding protein [Bdellovibrionales bacterium]MCB9254733.1 ABC transporter substrate-binding protein [Pseudobdellovibrionaceae bacterium]
MRFLKVAGLVCLLAFAACTKSKPKQTFWIYTSLYKEVIADMEKKLQSKFPDVDFKWYQSGSENVAARVNAELGAGETLADLLMTSDPFWYLELERAGHLMAYQSPNAKPIPDGFKEKSHAFVICRVPTVVMAYNKEAVPNPPKGWKDLLKPEWKGKVSMGSPLQSGTSFAAVAQLVRRYDWAYFQKLRENDLLSAGGNSAVITRMETKERPVGIVLLENVIDAQRKQSPIGVIYPEDGAILAPSPIAIVKTTKHPELAQQVYDYFLSDDMQEETVKGRMYSSIPTFRAPEGEKPFAEILANSFPWNAEVLSDIYAKREDIKKRFMEVVLN